MVQTQVLLRAGDPFYELGMPVMHRMEDPIVPIRRRPNPNPSQPPAS